MEVESSANREAQRFGLKNSIPTNFGSDYVFQIVPKVDWAAIAVSLSTNTVKLYSPVTAQYYGEFKGHTDTVNQIAFSSDLLHSCSSDGTIRSWDTRSFQQVACIDASDNGQEVFSFSFGDHLLAAGCKQQVCLWDWRSSKQVACLEESHMDDVTQVHFVPNNRNKLVSASVDGLVCLFNTEGDINDDDHLDSVINVGTSVGKIGFLGDSYQKLWCLTHIETLSPAGSIGPAEAILGGGHVDVVRSVLQMPSEYGGSAGLFGWTGGEDGRLCCWTSEENSAAGNSNNRSWTSSELVVKPSRNRQKNRHSPY
ncbi:hypothetical protein HID58_031399 [Brassica napus]|uniref:WD repeat-containing protein 89 homolog n=1 Tax=Brassica napus TaxID=3708 RepID=A0ABQ8BUN7_BRANA|nr:hypothetical protein HID58_031399 [Brassica napus]